MTEIIPGHDPSHGKIAEFGEKTEMTEIIKVMTCHCEIAEFGEMTEIIKVIPPATAKSPISPQRVCFALFYGFYLGFYRHYRGDPCKTYF